MSRRRSHDRRHARPIGPREAEAHRWVEQQPGITIAELADALGVGMNRIWRIVGSLERSGRVRRGAS